MFEETIGDLGSLKVVYIEPDSQSINVILTVPAFTLFSLLPVLGRHLALQHIEIDANKKVFMPSFEVTDFQVQISDSQLGYVHSVLNSKVSEVLSVINELKQLVDDPVRVLPLLPMGVVVNAELGCTLAGALEMLQDLSVQQTPMGDMLASAWTHMLEKICRNSGWQVSLGSLLTK